MSERGRAPLDEDRLQSVQIAYHCVTAAKELKKALEPRLSPPIRWRFERALELPILAGEESERGSAQARSESAPLARKGKGQATGS